MKKFLLAVFTTVLFASCSSSSPNNPTEETPTNFEVALNPSSLSLAVDETAVVSVESQSALTEVKWVWEGGSKSLSANDGEKLNGGINLYFQFAFPGAYPINLEFKDTNGKIVTKELNFQVDRGNTVQITGVEVLNFYDMGKEWDPEATGDEKLADVLWTLEKPQHVGFTKDEMRQGLWYISEVHKNESSLTWDLSGKQLFINPLFSFEFGLADEDEEGWAQNLMIDQLSYRIDLRDKMNEKPATVSLIDEQVDLHIIFHLDWPE